MLNISHGWLIDVLEGALKYFILATWSLHNLDAAWLIRSTCKGSLTYSKNTKVLLHLPWPWISPYWHHSVTSRHHIVKSREAVTSQQIITSHNRPVFCILALKPENHGNHDFWTSDIDFWPMTLAIALFQDIKSSWPYVEWFSCQRVHTLTHTHRRDGFYNVDRWCGR